MLTSNDIRQSVAEGEASRIYRFGEFQIDAFGRRFVETEKK
ncbi:MAG: hypothetical protein WKF90_15545 [Pyrinomonadaceae bacterium]